MIDLTNPNSINQSDFRHLSAAQIAQISPSAIASFDIQHSLWLSAAQTAALSAQQVSAVSPQQVAALAHALSLAPAAVAGLSAAQVPLLSINWKSASAAWLNALSPASFAAIPAAGISKFSLAAIQGLDAAAVRAMTPSQVAALAQPFKLTLSAVAGFTAEQIPLLAGNWHNAGSAWLNALSPAAFAAIPVAAIKQFSTAAVQGLDAAAVSGMTAQQITALPHPESLSLDAVTALTAAQIAAIPTTTWSKVNDTWLNALSPNAFTAIPPTAFGQFKAGMIQGLSASAVQGMNAQQFAAVVDPEWFSLSVAATLTPAQLSAATTHWDSVSADWLNALSPEAFAAIPPAGINQLSLAACQGLDATHMTIALPAMDATHAWFLDSAQPGSMLTYDSVLSGLQQLGSGIGTNGLSAGQFAAFNKLLANAKAVNGDNSYVSSLLSSVLNGGLQTGASADEYSALVNKWFLGIDDPAISANSSYKDVSGLALFTDSTKQASELVAQGRIGDCWLISSLEEIATDDPSLLSSMIGSNGNGTYAVRLYDGKNPFYLTVDGNVASYGAGTAAGNWVDLMEKAYIEAAADGLLTADGQKRSANSYSIIDGGQPSVALDAFTGGKSVNYSSGAAAYNAVASALENHTGLVVYSSFKDSKGVDGKTNLVSSHAFSVTGIDTSNGDFIFRNPWGPQRSGAAWDSTFEISAAELDGVSGSGYFSVSTLNSASGPATDSKVMSSSASARQTDVASLVQAMATFNVPPAASLTGTSGISPQTPGVGLVRPH
ncbi:C2 family cysteine protease [Paraburkholderia mimosarum]|uniref:C2 family cysteine protease n=1 Tax=Paraburkholderia mimosarum TaxID=312026 RepID=UPI000412C3E2|nr:C2 family cysteine protease [Paraburkholderia mimosarum]